MSITRSTLIAGIGLLLAVSAFGYICWYKPAFPKPLNPKTTIPVKKKEEGIAKTLLRLNKKALVARQFVAGHGYNNERCFLIDMRIPSGQNRFFVYNLGKDSIEDAGLVTHGSGVDNPGDVPVFSNTPNSNCTSLGKYRIGKPYYGKFGLAYKLYGLENSNSKAYERFVVLHSHACVPAAEVAPQQICESWGCPTVAPAFLERLQSLIDSSDRPVLLWIYY